MKNTSKYLAIGSAIITVGAAALVSILKRRSKDKEDLASSSYEDELAAEMAALREEEERIESNHENRMDDIRKAHEETMAKIEEIREELLNNVELRKNATPEESKELDERDMELLKKLYELK